MTPLTQLSTKKLSYCVKNTAVFFFISLCMSESVTNLAESAECTPISNNPCFQEVRKEIAKLAKEKNIPPVIIQAIAKKESSWNHSYPYSSSLPFCVSNIGLQNVKYNCELDGRVGIGLMQITISPYDYDFNNLSSDWKYNLRAGVNKLWSKWEEQRKQAPNDNGLDIDPSIIENWYYPVMWYNGEGDRAWLYVKEAFTFMSKPPTNLATFWDKVTGIKSPDGIINMPNNEPYLLKELASKSVAIHQWNSITESYSDITNQVLNGQTSSLSIATPYFDGTGSLIDPTNCTGQGWGCSHDEVKLHSHPNQISAGFFQVFRVNGACDAVRLEGLAAADIEVRLWDSYGIDSKYYHVDDMKDSGAVIPLIYNENKWNLIGVKTTAAIGDIRTLSAKCDTGGGMSDNVSEVSGTPMKFDENYSWGGNGSIISHAQNGEYGKIKDEVVLFRDKKTLAAIQVTKTAQCSKVTFNTFNTPNGFHLSWKEWDATDWQGDQVIYNGQSFPLPSGGGQWVLLKIKAEATGQNGSYVQAVCS